MLKKHYYGIVREYKNASTPQYLTLFTRFPTYIFLGTEIFHFSEISPALLAKASHFVPTFWKMTGLYINDTLFEHEFWNPGKKSG